MLSFVEREMKRNRVTAGLRPALWPIVVLAAVLLGPPSARADIHVVGALRVEPAPEWGRQASNLSLPREWWFGRNIMALNIDDWRYVFDKVRSRILVINLKDGYFVEASMTADVKDLVDPGFLDALRRYQVQGTVAKSPLKMTVLGAECPGTVVSEWLAVSEQHLLDRDRTIYACAGVPFDWRMSRDLTMWMVSFFNPQMAYFGGLRSIDGFPLAETDVATKNTQRVSYNTIVTEMYEAGPPAGIYEVPAGSRRQEKLTQRDILAMRQLLYLIYFF
jgi:hypothetical protein